ncbi:mercuric reductase [Flavobacterium ardleyense]|uniref:mercuric reductase n=1 Tax=Flavobacterium ardleyense TaxID=2038737 RepID=UPI00298CD3AF|nr:mercuric reductase [Flavobacterium ardleyense]
MKKVDAIIIGSGQAGNPLAMSLAYSGMKVILIEKHQLHIGGTCLNDGCTPSKTLIASAKVAHIINTSEKHGITTEKMNIDFATTQKRKDKIVLDSRKGLIKRLEETKNLEVIIGTASFSDAKIITVTDKNGKTQEYTAENIFINAGCRPMIPEIEGLENVKYYDSTSLLELKEIPKELIVLGGSYIGLELGQAFSRLGATTTIVERSAKLMSKEDNDVAESILECLENEGMQFHFNSEAIKVSEKDGEISVTIKKGAKETQIHGSHLFIATGRIPNSDLLNLENARIKADENGHVLVNNNLETNVKGVFALGDIKGGPQFTQIAYDDFRIVRDNILHSKKRSYKNRPIPYCMYTDPQLGRIGISEQDAKEQKLDVEIISIPGRRITRGIESGTTEGLWKAIIDKKTNKILGAAIIGSEGGEIATVLQMAMQGNHKATDIRDGIFSHPSYSESLNTLFDQLK